MRQELIDQLRTELEADEGSKGKIYLDHLGLPTFGIGHLVTEWDPEYNWEVGTLVTKVRCKEAFEKDVSSVLADCVKLHDNFNDLPDEVQLILANMMFNMGYPRLSKFKKMHGAIKESDWLEASLQMEDSKWYNQVPNRAERLVGRMAQQQTFPHG